MKCKVTNKSITPFMSFGKMPIANGFLDKKEWYRLIRVFANVRRKIKKNT